MSLTNTIIASIRKARLAAGDLIVDVTVRNVTRVYANGVNTSTSVDSLVKGFVDKFTTDEIDGAMIRQDDFKIYLFNEDNSVTVNTADKIVIDGLILEVIKSMPQFVGPLKPFIMVQARK